MSAGLYPSDKTYVCACLEHGVKARVVWALLYCGRGSITRDVVGGLMRMTYCTADGVLFTQCRCH